VGSHLVDNNKVDMETARQQIVVHGSRCVLERRGRASPLVGDCSDQSTAMLKVDCPSSIWRSEMLSEVASICSDMSIRILEMDMRHNNQDDVVRLSCHLGVVGLKFEESILYNLQANIYEKLDLLLDFDTMQRKHTVIEVLGPRSIGIHCNISRGLLQLGIQIDRAHVVSCANKFLDVFHVTHHKRPLPTNVLPAVRAAIILACNTSVHVSFSQTVFRERVESSLLCVPSPCLEVSPTLPPPTADSSKVTDLSASVPISSCSSVSGSQDNISSSSTNAGSSDPVRLHRSSSLGLQFNFLRRSPSRRIEMLETFSSCSDSSRGESILHAVAEHCPIPPTVWPVSPVPLKLPDIDTGVQVLISTLPPVADEPADVPQPSTGIRRCSSSCCDFGKAEEEHWHHQKQSTVKQLPKSEPLVEVQILCRWYSYLAVDVLCLFSDMMFEIVQMHMEITADHMCKIVTTIDTSRGTGHNLLEPEKRDWLAAIIRCVASSAPAKAKPISIVEYIAEVHPTFFESCATAFMNFGTRINWCRVGCIEDRIHGQFHLTTYSDEDFASDIDVQLLNHAVISAITS